MKTLATCTLALLLLTTSASAADLKIGFDGDDPLAEMGPRRNARDARVAIRSRDRSTVLLMTNDVLAVQLSDHALAQMKADGNEENPGFLEELLLAGVKIALSKSIEYPLASIRSVDYQNGRLRIVSDQNKVVFHKLRVNGTDVLADFSRTDALKLVSAFRAHRAR